MAKLITLDNHRCLKVTNDIQMICNPLFTCTPINYFNFVRVYPDGSRLTLCTQTDWMEYYFKNDLYNSSVFIINKECLENRYFFHHAHIDNSVIQIAASGFNVCYGFAIIKKHKNYIDFYHFATSRDKVEIYNFYLNNLNILERFALFFEEKAHNLICSVKPYRPEIQKINTLIEPATPTNPNKEFIKATHFKKIFLDRQNNLYITYREAECLYFLLNGFTAKEIAKHTNLSSRTGSFTSKM